MKNLILSTIFATVAFIGNAQIITPCLLSDVKVYEKVLFDKYDIHYAGGWSRFVVSSGDINKLDKDFQESIKREVSAFEKWNKGYFQTVPTKTPLFDMEFYLTGKEFESVFLNTVLRNPAYKITGLFEKQVNDLDFNIKKIIILETYSDSAIESQFAGIDHMILVQQFDGKYRSISYTDEFINFGDSECISCSADF